MKEKELFSRNFKKYYKIYVIATFAITLLEIFLMIRGLIIFDFSKWKHVGYFIAYIFLFILSIYSFLVLVLYKNRFEEKISFFKIVIELYCVGIVLWSMFISFFDMIETNSPIVYLTIIMAVACVTITNPKRFAVISALSLVVLIASLFIYNSINNKELLFINSGIIINMVVFELTAVLICYKLYISSVEELKAFNTLSFLSVTDQLTGLNNRRSLDDTIFNEHVKMNKYVFALVDIDDFKHINDFYGHKVGDDVLIDISKIIISHFGTGVFRYGGDEIAVISKDSVEEVYNKFLKIQKEIRDTITSCSIQISYGIYNNTKNEGPKDVFIKADKALYIAKNSGKNCGYIYKND